MMNNCHKKYNEHGTFTVWALGLCVTLFMIGGLSVDLWRAFSQRRTLTEIADSAARNGANNIDVDQRALNGTVVIEPNSAKTSAQQSINDNAALNNVNITSSTITVDAATNEIDVEINSNYSFFLLGFFPGAENTTIIAHARATPIEGQ
jgi:Flp pilus assembly protein TadG